MTWNPTENNVFARQNGDSVLDTPVYVFHKVV